MCYFFIHIYKTSNLKFPIMKKFYLLLLPLFIWGMTAKAAPLEGYEAPTLPKEGNVGNIVSFTTSGALEDLQNINIPKTPTGKMAQELK